MGLRAIERRRKRRRLGIIVNAKTSFVTLGSSACLNEKLRASVASTIFISSVARCRPGQKRGPAPNCKKALVLCAAHALSRRSTHRSGLKALHSYSFCRRGSQVWSAGIPAYPWESGYRTTLRPRWPLESVALTRASFASPRRPRLRKGRAWPCRRTSWARGHSECIHAASVQFRFKVPVAGEQVCGPGEAVCRRVLAGKKQRNDICVHVVVAEAGIRLIDECKHCLKKISMASAARAAHRPACLCDHLLYECADRLQGALELGSLAAA